MNRKETLQILALLRVAYPGFYRSQSEEEARDTLTLWCDQFADDAYAQVRAAVDVLIATDEKGYPPHIGAVRAALARLTSPPELTEMEAWTLVRKYMSAYATREEFLQLPPAVRRAVGGSSQLCQWALTEQSALPVIMSNFMRSYAAALAEERERARLPGRLLALLPENRAALAPGADEPAEPDDSP